MSFAFASSPSLRRLRRLQNQRISPTPPASRPRCSATPPQPRLSRRALLALACHTALIPPLAAAASDDAYDAYAPTYDVLDSPPAALPTALGFTSLRTRALALAAGATLEVACGTGANFALYPPRVTAVTAVDISEGMLTVARAQAGALSAGPPFDVARGDAAALPRDWGGRFDTVVDTFSLCAISEPAAALAEMRRVVRREGRVILVEHCVSEFGPLAAYQDLVARPVAAGSKGCFWNQDVVGLARSAGLRVVSAERALGGTVVSLVLCRDDAETDGF